MPLSESVSAFLQQSLPGCITRLHDPGKDRVIGSVIWDGFADLYEEERLKAVWTKLRSRFGPDSSRIGVLLLFTPSEYGALNEAA